MSTEPSDDGQEWRDSHPVVFAGVSLDASTLTATPQSEGWPEHRPDHRGWLVLRSSNGQAHATLHGTAAEIRAILTDGLATLPEEA